MDNYRKWIYLFAPIAWGAISYVVFSLLGPTLPEISGEGAPKWIWLWILQILIIIPFWRILLKEYSSYRQRNGLKIFKLFIPFGKPKFYLILAYITVVPTIFTYDQWYGKWLVFGGIVSPVFEELFCRYCLLPFFKERFYKFLIAAVVSAACFSLMHWGYNGLAAFDLTAIQQFQKFQMHFVFGFVLSLIFRFTRSIQLVIWLHVASNLNFILTKL